MPASPHSHCLVGAPRRGAGVAAPHYTATATVHQLYDTLTTAVREAWAPLCQLNTGMIRPYLTEPTMALVRMRQQVVAAYRDFKFYFAVVVSS